MTKILITGATGFAGRASFENLKFKKKYLAHLTIRTNQKELFIGGKAPEVSRLIDSLRVNSSHTRKILEWKPPFSLDEGLKKTVRWHLKSR